MSAETQPFPVSQAENEPSAYQALEAHWKYVLSLATGTPNHSALVSSVLDGEPTITEAYELEELDAYTEAADAAGGYELYRAGQAQISDGDMVRFDRDPEDGKIAISLVFFSPDTVVNFNQYQKAQKSNRQIIIYTVDGIYYITDHQLADLRAAEEDIPFSENHWYTGLADQPPITIGQPWQFSDTSELPPVTGVEILINSAHVVNERVVSMRSVGPNAFGMASDLHMAGKPKPQSIL